VNFSDTLNKEHKYNGDIDWHSLFIFGYLRY
jgi:hypothetical protein